jgi:hypothetical protein
LNQYPNLYFWESSKLWFEIKIFLWIKSVPTAQNFEKDFLFLHFISSQSIIAAHFDFLLLFFKSKAAGPFGLLAQQQPVTLSSSSDQDRRCRRFMHAPPTPCRPLATSSAREMTPLDLLFCFPPSTGAAPSSSSL